jgi:predicted RNA methylase
VPDARFDRVYPVYVQKSSDLHWTPVAVAKRAAQMLVTGPRSRILDIGSGAGKFCIVAALTTRGEFVGIEQRPYLVEAAKAAVARWEVQRVLFVMSNMAKIDWRQFSGFYLFNPFYEHVSEPTRIDNLIQYSKFQYERYLDIVKNRLRLAARGTRVVTYYGFGGEMPIGYKLELHEPQESDALELWVKE